AYFFALAKSQGDACLKGFECASGFCSGGVCCDSLCAGPCESCSVADGTSVVGTCTPLDGVACDDGNPCTQTAKCSAGICFGGAPKTCPGDACNDGVCDPSLEGDGCTLVPKPDGAACTDEDPCTTGDTCQSGACTGGAPLKCPDLDACHLGVCDPMTGD